MPDGLFTDRTASGKRVLPFGATRPADDHLVVLYKVPGATLDELERIQKWLAPFFRDLHYGERKVIFSPLPEQMEITQTTIDAIAAAVTPHVIRRMGGDRLPQASLI
jgi:hypothetical protein